MDGATGRRKRKRSRGSGGGNNAASSGANGRPKRKKRRRGGGGRNGRSADAQRALEPIRDDSSILGGGRSIQKQQVEPLDGDPDGFKLFCAYHLGVTLDDGYKQPSLEETARRFGLNKDEVRDLLAEHRVDNETVKNSSFDMVGAKLDIKLAPEGISRTATARELYDEYVAGLD